ncbi:ABC transporter ATP-binding protein [Butyrivibrio sp. NC3005]|uniref:ABC transporter ATP-binding protein n=1 Tax=Butyrivibrio sp. NC3005 TaxID=1280685 RepID=UPI0003F783BF|nr:ABC transporter ATP-binding protein [Butyrivibrio sp. NC3005]
MKVLEVNEIYKKKDKKSILKGISFDIGEKEVVGLLGPNGSGKSTTIKSICGLYKPDNGTVNICGFDVKKARKRAMENLGVAMENPSLYVELTGFDNLKMFAIERKVSKERLDEIIELIGLSDNIHRKAGTYSQGMKMRLNLGLAIMHKPKLIILDEPTNGLDPDAVFQLRSIIYRLREDGSSIMFSSHQLSEVEKIADRIIAIDKGKVLSQKTIIEIKGKYNHLEDFYKGLYN